jgi:hypothetical protein
MMCLWFPTIALSRRFVCVLRGPSRERHAGLTDAQGERHRWALFRLRQVPLLKLAALPRVKACAVRFTRVAVELSVRRSPLASKLEDVMSVIDQALKSNEQYAKAYDPRLGAHPQPAIAVVTYMDPRLSDLEGILGLEHADMGVIRNGGPAVMDEVLAELVVSTRVLGTKESAKRRSLKDDRIVPLVITGRIQLPVFEWLHVVRSYRRAPGDCQDKRLHYRLSRLGPLTYGLPRS